MKAKPKSRPGKEGLPAPAAGELSSTTVSGKAPPRIPTWEFVFSVENQEPSYTPTGAETRRSVVTHRLPRTGTGGHARCALPSASPPPPKPRGPGPGGQPAPSPAPLCACRPPAPPNSRKQEPSNGFQETSCPGFLHSNGLSNTSSSWDTHSSHGLSAVRPLVVFSGRLLTAPHWLKGCRGDRCSHAGWPRCGPAAGL